MNVDRCVCFSLSFEELKALAREQSLDFDRLRAKTHCCSRCSLCEPYVRRMLATGETVFVLDRKSPAPVAGATLVGLGVVKRNTGTGE